MIFKRFSHSNYSMKKQRKNLSESLGQNVTRCCFRARSDMGASVEPFGSRTDLAVWGKNVEKELLVRGTLFK